MSYKEKPLIKLFRVQSDNSFKLEAIIDDYESVSFEHSKYEAGQFSIQINFNIPNSQKFEEKMFLQFGNEKRDFGIITNVSDSIGPDGKGSQIRTIIGRDARYLFKQRIIRNLNFADSWTYTGSGEKVMRELISAQCGENAEQKRRLPIKNLISQDGIGSVYTVSEAYSNLYDVLVTIATQTEIGWQISFTDGEMVLEFYPGIDRHSSVRFDTDYNSLADGNYEVSTESFANTVYVGGKGSGENKDVYEGELQNEDGTTPSGLDRFEAWDDSSSLENESEYSNEAQSKLNEYGQTVSLSGNGLAKCPYEFRKQYDIGDIITISFSGKKAVAQIISITEHWSWGQYEISFEFGKPIQDLSRQLSILLSQIRTWQNTENNKTSNVKYYNIPEDTEQPNQDVILDVIGFTGNLSNDSTFKLYFDKDSKVGAKTYHIYFKQLVGDKKLTVTTGIEGIKALQFSGGTYVAIIYVDENGNIGKVIGSSKISELDNDSGFITEEDVPTNTSELNNDSGFITKEDIPSVPTKTSQLNNDSGFITKQDIPAIPTKTSQLNNDSGFITRQDIPSSLPANGGTSDYLAVRTTDNIDVVDLSGIRCDKVYNYDIGWVSYDGMIITIPWSVNYAFQIAVDDQSNWIAIRSMTAKTWNSWERLAKASDIPTIPTSLPANGGTANAIQATVGDNDFIRIIGRDNGSNAGYLEIATADDGNEPIVVRQYIGVFERIVRQLTLLDESGNTELPGMLSSYGTYNRYRSYDLRDTSVWDENTWYPCVFIISSLYRERFQIDRALDAGKSANWQTHNGGFSMHLDFETIGGGWGTNEVRTMLYDRSESFTDGLYPVGTWFDDETNAVVLYLRGGAIYSIKTTTGGAGSLFHDGWSSNVRTWYPGGSERSGFNMGTVCGEVGFSYRSGNSDTLDGRHDTGFTYVYDHRTGGTGHSLDSVKALGNFTTGMFSGGNPYGTTWAHALTFGWSGSDERWSSQIALCPEVDDKPMMFRNGLSGWKTVIDNTNILNYVHPVGSYYWSSDPTDPHILFGGTWERIKDRFIYAQGDSGSVGDTGGSKKISADNLPQHTHPAGDYYMPSHSHNWEQFFDNGNPDGWSDRDDGLQNRRYMHRSNLNGDRKTDIFGISTSSAGGSSSKIGGTSGKNTTTKSDFLPPYITAYCWRRTA